MQVSALSTLTLFHYGQLWVGVVERIEDGELGIAWIVFGVEPSDEKILQSVVSNWEKPKRKGR